MDFEIQKKEVEFTWIKIYSTFEKKNTMTMISWLQPYYCKHVERVTLKID